MAGFLYKGILLQQHKEPALSRNLREFFNADNIGAQMQRPPVSDPDALTPVQIIDIARDARIIDERDGVPLSDKLECRGGRSPRLLIADAIDDEPYISSQINPMLKNQELAADGLRFAQRATGATYSQFAVYKNLTDLEVRIPKTIKEFRVERIRGRYPAEYQASKAYASTHDVVTVGVCALIFLARAIRFNRPQTSAFITVAGDCIGNPTNLEASIGVTVSQALERCGLIDDPARVIIGGSMTGISVIDTDKTLIQPTTRAILAFRENPKVSNFSCIGCSRCVHVCPEGLNPFFLYRSVRQKRYDVFRGLDAQMCIGCGTCSYMCPAKLDLSETIINAREEIRGSLVSMRSTSILCGKKEQTAFDSYMSDYRYRAAQRAHRRTLRQLAQSLAKQEQEAGTQREHAIHTADALFENAKREQQAAVTAAEQSLEQARQDGAALVADIKQKADGVHREGEAIIAAAERAVERAGQDGRDLVAASEKAKEKVRQEGNALISAAEKAVEKSRRDGQGLISAAEKELERLGREGQSAIHSAEKERDKLQREGQGLISAAEKAVEKTSREGVSAQNAAQKQADKLLEKSNRLELSDNPEKVTPEIKAQAKEEYKQAQADVKRAAEQSAAADQRALEDVEAAKKQAAELLLRGEAGIREAQAQAAGLTKRGGEDVDKARVQADELYQAALKALEEAKAQAEKMVAQAQLEVEKAQVQADELIRQAQAALEQEKLRAACMDQDAHVKVEQVEGHGETLGQAGELIRQAEEACQRVREHATEMVAQAQQRWENDKAALEKAYQEKLDAIHAEDLRLHQEAEQLLETARVEAENALLAAKTAEAAVTGRSYTPPEPPALPPEPQPPQEPPFPPGPAAGEGADEPAAEEAQTLPAVEAPDTIPAEQENAADAEPADTARAAQPSGTSEAAAPEEAPDEEPPAADDALPELVDLDEELPLPADQQPAPKKKGFLRGWRRNGRDNNDAGEENLS